MPERIAGALSRTSIRILLAVVLVCSAGAGVFAADLVGTQQPAATQAPPPSATAAPAAQPVAATDDGSDVGFKLNGGGGKNIVKITNKTDNRLIVRGRVDFNRIPGDKVAPVNAAIAVASCIGCQTYAVALQIDLYQRGASFVAPQNAAVAVNAGCSHCVTVARAIQYAIPVDDVKAVPNDVKKLARALDKELKGIEGTYDTATFNVYQANARINDVVAEFRALANSLLDQYRIETASDSPSPSPDAAQPAVDPNATDTPSASNCPASTSPDPAVSPSAETASPDPACDTSSHSPDGSAPASESPPASAGP